MPDFIFMLHDHRTNESKPIKKVLQEAHGPALHHFLHEIATELMIEMELDGGQQECDMADELDGSVVIIRDRSGAMVALLTAYETETYTVTSPADGLGLLGDLLGLAGAPTEVTAAGFKNLPDELQAVLREAAHDKDAPEELRKMLSEMIGEQGAPSNETVH